MKILVLNAGSSTQKSCLFDASAPLPATPPHPLWEGYIDWAYSADKAEVKVKSAAGAAQRFLVPVTSRVEVMSQVLATLWAGDRAVLASPQDIDVVGHRIVHGGDRYRDSAFVTAEVKQAIAACAAYAPIHNPANLEGIELAERILGAATPQVAVFDTAFHARLSPAAATYPLPFHLYEKGIRRYGFHGISHQYVAARAAAMLGRDPDDLRLISCHLGNGCSLAAVRGGHSVDTTMGFTPMAGVMMGTRCGDIDPGILLYLMREEGYSAEGLDRLLNRASGLLGVSGLSNDLRPILMAIAEGNARAQLAYDVFIHRLRAGIGAMLGALGGLDAIAFTAGIGENAPQVRADACAGFGFLGAAIDPTLNEGGRGDRDISTAEATVRVLVVHTEEDWAIARECSRLVSLERPL